MGLFTPTGKDLFVKPADIKSGTVDQFLVGLAKKESSGNAKALGPVITSGMYTGDRAYGKYQIMGKNVPEWSQKYLGKKLTAEQLYQNEQLQDELMKRRAQELYSKYGNWEDVASVHFTGQPLKKAGNVKDQLGTTAPKYVQDVLAFMRGDSPAVKYQSPLTPGTAGSTPAMQDQTVWNTAMQNIGEHPLIQGPLKALDFIGTTIDKGFGIPARLGGAIGSKVAGGSFSDQGIPETMSGQLEEATTGLTGSPTAGAVAGLLGSIAQPFPGLGKVSKVDDLLKTFNREQFFQKQVAKYKNYTNYTKNKFVGYAEASGLSSYGVTDKTVEWVDNLMNANPTKIPNEVIKDLGKFKRNEPLTLYTGNSIDNLDLKRTEPTSFTSDLSVAQYFGSAGRRDNPAILKIENVDPKDVTFEFDSIPRDILRTMVGKNVFPESEVVLKKNLKELSQKYNVSLSTDGGKTWKSNNIDKGVSWYEVSIRPEMGNKPMEAFAMGALPFAPIGYDQMTQAQENQNNKETIQLNPFKPGFLTSSQTVNKIDPPAQPPAFTEDKKRGFQGNNSMNPDGLSRIGLNPLIPANKPKTQASNAPMKVEIQQVGPTLMAMPKKKYTLDEVRQKMNVKYHPGNNGFYNSLSPNKEVVENFKKHFPDPGIALIMRGISKAESGGKQDAYNKNTEAKGKYKDSLDVGFFQINDTNRRHKFDKRGNIIYTETPEAFRVRMLNLDENFKEAKRLLYEGGFERWATFNEGKHIPFLEQYLEKAGQ